LFRARLLHPGHPVAVSDEGVLVERLRAGDEAAFDALIASYGPSMLRVATLYVRVRAVAEEVVQDTWVRVLQSLDRFEGRSSLRTWIFVILANVARTRLEREARSVPIASLDPGDERAVSDERFFPSSHPRWAGMWSTLVDAWESLPDEQLLNSEARAKLRAAIDRLPPRYGMVFTLRDIEGWAAEEVASLLDLTPENQRVILHRARSRIRAALESYVEGETT